MGLLTDVHGRGVIASRPAAGHAGRFYYSTDTTTNYRDNGSSWDAQSTSGLTDPMTTRGDMLIRNASNVTARVPIGSAGKVWTSDGTDPSWQTPTGAGGGLVLLESHTAATSTTLDFVTRNAAGQSGATIQSDFDDYAIEVVGVIPANNNVSLKCSLSSNGGSSWNATSNYYSALGYVINTGGGGGTAFGNPTTFWVLADTLSNSSSRSVNAALRLMSPGSTTLDKTLFGPVTYTNQGNFVGGTLSGLFTVPGTAFNALQFLMSAGNISVGTIRILGIPK